MYVPGAAELEAARVNVLVPAPGADRVAELKVPMTPVGKPATESVMGALKEFVKLLTASVNEPDAWPGWITEAA